MPNRIRKCFLDFDGTVVNNQKRLFQFFRENIDPKFRDVLDIQEFWTLKRCAVHELDWINRTFKTDYSLQAWNEKKAAEIENAHYLSFEEIFDFSVETLNRLRSKYYLVLVTRRENKEGLFEELKRFGIRELFDEIIVLNHNGVTKSEVIRQRFTVNADDLFVGDTEDDLISGNELGCSVYFVLSGIRGKWLAQKLNLGVNVICDISEIK